jgi:hypothetical protein
MDFMKKVAITFFFVCSLIEIKAQHPEQISIYNSLKFSPGNIPVGYRTITVKDKSRLSSNY